MKSFALLSSLLFVSACSSGTVQGPTALADGATAGMWSIKPPEEVAACLAGIQTGTQGPGTPLKFEALPADPRKTRYATVVMVYGDVSSHLDAAEAAAGCL